MFPPNKLNSNSILLVKRHEQRKWFSIFLQIRPLSAHVFCKHLFWRGGIESIGLYSSYSASLSIKEDKPNFGDTVLPEHAGANFNTMNTNKPSIPLLICPLACCANWCVLICMTNLDNFEIPWKYVFHLVTSLIYGSLSIRKWTLTPSDRLLYFPQSLLSFVWLWRKALTGRGASVETG